jgi:hypothetical protein
MDDADLLCNRATPIFALAARSRQEGYSEYATEQFGARGRQARGSNRKALPLAEDLLSNHV